MSDTFTLRRGETPLLVSVPHAGLTLSDGLEARLTPVGLRREDTDWHVNELYDFLGATHASVISARYSRYVVDLNRPPDGSALYPGKSETALVPHHTFGGEAIYLPGAAPDALETGERVRAYWCPYHDALALELARIRERFGYAILWDAHSIQSHVPTMFQGQLPDLNLGTNNGRSCAPALAAALTRVLKTCPFETVVDGRFRGGYITRHYGDPTNHVHAVQMEIAQISYMSEYPAFRYDAQRAERLRPVLRQLFDVCLRFRGDA